MKNTRTSLIITLLIMVVSLSSSAQDTIDVYSTYSSSTIDTDWNIDPDSDDNNSAYYPSSPTFGQITLFSVYSNENAKYSFNKGFNLDNLDSIQISYDVSNLGTGTSSEPFTFEILVSEDDIIYTSAGAYSGTIGEVNSIMLDNTNFAPTSINTFIKVVFTFSESIPTVSGYESINVKLNDFSIEGYKESTSLGISDNSIENNLIIYSHNKSIFLSSNENVNANITVYNMSGQLVFSDANRQLSQASNSIYLGLLESGIYIVNLESYGELFSSKIYLK